MQEQLDREHPLFEKEVLVRIENAVGHDDRSVPLVVRVLQGRSLTSTLNLSSSATQDLRKTCSKYNSQPKGDRIYVELTDPDDPFFLFSLQVTEEDFCDLKRDQNLLVDFASFGPNFIELLQQVSSNTVSEQKDEVEDIQASSPRQQSFLAVLSISDRPVFRLVETNQFKHLTHLSLKLQRGNDETIKRFLVGQLQQASRNVTQLQEELGATQLSLTRTTQDNESLTRKVEQLEHSQVTLSRELRVAHQEEVAALKEQFAKELAEQHQSNTTTTQKRQSELEEQVKQLTERLDSIRTKHEQLSVEHGNLQAEFRSQAQHLTVARRDLEIMQTSASSAQQESLTTKTIQREQEQEINSLRVEVATLKQQVIDKQSIVENGEKLLEAERANSNHREKEIELHKRNINKLQRKLQQSIDEIKKGNLVIERLHQDVAKLSQKVRVKAMVIRKQEDHIVALEDSTKQLKETLEQMKIGSLTTKSDTEKLQQQLHEAQENLSKAKKEIESNQNVIAYLNKEINQYQLGHGGSFSSPSTFASTSPASGGYYSTPYSSAPPGSASAQKHSFAATPAYYDATPNVSK